MDQLNSINDYPIILNARHVAEILHVSKTMAYQLMKQTDFPTIKNIGKTKRVLRDRFFEWVQAKSAL